MSARVYRDHLRCPHCGSNRTPKDGHSRGKQTLSRCRVECSEHKLVR